MSSLKTSLVGLAASLATYGAYHHFATNNQEITATVTGKNFVSIKDNTYYNVGTDKGVMRDNVDLWEGKFNRSRNWRQAEEGQAYIFKVNHDKIFGTNNILEMHADPNAAKGVTVKY